MPFEPRTIVRLIVSVAARVAICASLCGASWGCGAGTIDPAASARQISEAQPREGLGVAAIYGAIVEATDVGIEIWASAPTGRLTIDASSVESRPLSVSLQNTGTSVAIETRAVTLLGAAQEAGCPDRDRRLIACSSLMDVSEREKFCAPVDVQSGEVEGGVQFELPVEPCREVDYRWGPAESPADEVVRLIAIGTVDDLATIEAIVEETSSESPRPSMYVLLGDQLPEASSEGITSYRAFLGGLQVPTVVAAGERALADDEGAKFRRTFGPTDFLFDVGSTHVMVFASIDQTLGVRGMSRLENFARALPDDGIRVAVTHSPPLAMAGLEEQAFRSRLEGARVLSVLSEQGVDVLLAGHALSTAREEQAGIEVFVTSSRDTAFGADGRYLDLRLRPGGEAPIEGRFRELP